MAGGRPRLTFDLSKVEYFAERGASYEDLAVLLDTSVAVIHDRVEEGAAFAKAYKTGATNLRMGLRMAQVEAAIKNKNPALLIWLGKNLLGQSDQIDHNHYHDVAQIKANERKIHEGLKRIAGELKVA